MGAEANVYAGPVQFRSPGLSSLSSSLATALLVIACNGDDTVTSATDSATTDATTTDTTSDTTTATTTATTDDTTSMTTTATTTMTTTSTTETTAVSATETTTATTTTTTTTTTGESESDSDSDTTTGDPGEVVECGGEPLMVGDGVCTVAAPGTKGILLRGTVLAPDTTYNGGGVLVVDDVIVCVGCDCQDAPEAAEASRIDCAEGVISPGLINTHDHLGFANNVPIGEGPDRYEHRHDWRKGQNGHVKITTAGSANKRQIEAGELRFLLGGATSTIGGGAGRAGLLRNLDSNLKEGLTVATVDSDTFPLDDADGMQVEMGCVYGANPTEAADITDLDAYLPHIAEGINKAAHNEFICTSEGSGDVIEPQSGVVHAIALDASDVATMQVDRAKLVWSPRSNIVLYGNTAAVTAFDAIGVPIALGSDWVL